MLYNKKISGFSLIELMTVVAIIGVLSAIAAPRYQTHVESTRRADVQRVMYELASKEEQYMMNNQSYITDFTVNGLNYFIDPDVLENYDVFIELKAGPPEGYVIKAKGVGLMSDDGSLSLDSEGVKTPPERW